MKLSKLAAGLVLSASVLSLSASAITAKANKWQMAGFGFSIDLSKNEYLNALDYNSIWFYEDGNWKAYSGNTSIQNAIENKEGLEFDSTINANQAFWIYPNKDIKIPKFTPVLEKIPNKQGWHLVSLSQGHWSLDELLKNHPNMKSIFAYRDGKWEYRHKDQVGILTGNLTNTYDTEGFWINNSFDLSSNSMLDIYNEHKNMIFESFSNKKFIIGSNLEITLNQNGTVQSTDSKYDGAKWQGREYIDEYGWTYIRFKLNKDNTNYYFNISTNYEQSTNSNKLQLTRISKRDIEILDTGVVKSLDFEVLFNTSIYDNASPDTPLDVSIQDTTVATSNTTVQSKIQELDTILNSQTSDVKTKLSQIKNSISTIEHNDAKVLTSVINMIEVLDSSVIQELFTFDNNAFSMNSLFASNTYPQTVEELLNLSETITNYSGNFSDLLSSFSTKLKSSSDLLKDVSTDDNYVFSYKDSKMNNVDIKALRVSMLALAFKLELFASYNFGSDDWFKIKNQNNFDYIQASIDPVSYINSGDFFSNPSSIKLQNSKSYLVEALSIYKDMIDGDYHDKEGLNVTANDTNGRNIKFYLTQALKNLNGEKNSFVLNYDNSIYDMNTYELKAENEKFVFDLNSLFDASKTITSNDFAKLKYENNAVLNLNNSIIHNNPVDINHNELEIIEDESTIPTTVNNINNILKMIVDNDGNTISSDSLIQELFN